MLPSLQNTQLVKQCHSDMIEFHKDDIELIKNRIIELSKKGEFHLYLPKKDNTPAIAIALKELGFEVYWTNHPRWINKLNPWHWYRYYKKFVQILW